MKHKITILGFILASGMLAACGGRVAQPIAVSNSWDAKLSCSHLYGEYQNHDKRLVELTGERKDKPMHNVGMLLSSPLFLDLSQAQKEEAKAIYNRQERLSSIMQNKSCTQYQSLQRAEIVEAEG